MKQKYLLLISIVLLCVNCNNDNQAVENPNEDSSQTTINTEYLAKTDSVEKNDDTVVDVRENQSNDPILDSLGIPDGLKVTIHGKNYYKRNIEDISFTGAKNYPIWIDSKKNVYYDITSGKDTYIDFGIDDITEEEELAVYINKKVYHLKKLEDRRVEGYIFKTMITIDTFEYYDIRTGMVVNPNEDSSQTTINTEYLTQSDSVEKKDDTVVDVRENQSNDLILDSLNKKDD